MLRTRWTERKFSFDFPEGILPNIIERLAGTTARLKELVMQLSEAEAAEKLATAWSIKEHIGHLGDLEELHDGRITDFLLRKPSLRAADMSNRKTYQSNHNKKSNEQLILEFSTRRNHFVKRLQLLDDELQCCKCMHPRLKILMRPVDVAYFTAEHDDHHLASIRELIEISEKARSLFSSNSIQGEQF
jgi:hypothetical protein